MVRIPRWLRYGLILMPIGAASCLHGASTLPISAISAINRTGISANLQLCLDVADVDSYSGSGQTWSDLSGNSYDFLRGATSGAESSDPTFVGTAGNLLSSTYWVYDDTEQWFTLGQSNPTWITNLHKNNAVGTFLIWYYSKAEASSGITYVIDTYDDNPSSSTGFSIELARSSDPVPGAVTFRAQNAGTTVGGAGTTAEGYHVDDDQWNFIGISVDESVGAGGALWQVNEDAFVDGTAFTYTSPSAGAATNVARIGFSGSGINNSARIAVLCGFSRALTAAEMTAFFEATRQRFGI